MTPRALSSAVFVLSLALCLPASAQTADSGAPQITTRGQSTLNARDKAFLERAATFNAPEIHAALLAEDAANNPNVKAYARLALSDHNGISNDLSALAERLEVNLPDPCDHGGDQALHRLKSERGASFDHAYMEKQARDHQNAIDVFEEEAKSAGDGEVGQFASQTLAVLRQHLDLVRLISGALYEQQAAK